MSKPGTASGLASRTRTSTYVPVPNLALFIYCFPAQPSDFPNPTNVDPTRPLGSYNLNGAGFHGCPGLTYAEQTIAEIVKVVFKLKNVRRAAGDAGKLAGFKMVINETETNVYLTPYGTTTPWPGSMYLAVRFRCFGLIICSSYTSTTTERPYCGPRY